MKPIFVALTLILATTSAAVALGFTLATSHATLEVSLRDVNGSPACYSLAGCQRS